MLILGTVRSRRFLICRCEGKCSVLNKAFYALHGTLCRCGDATMPASSQTPDSDCSYPCPANSSISCGARQVDNPDGKYRLSVYQVTVTTTTTTTTIPATTTTRKYAMSRAHLLNLGLYLLAAKVLSEAHFLSYLWMGLAQTLVDCDKLSSKIEPNASTDN